VQEYLWSLKRFQLDSNYGLSNSWISYMTQSSQFYSDMWVIDSILQHCETRISPPDASESHQKSNIHDISIYDLWFPSARLAWYLIPFFSSGNNSSIDQCVQYIQFPFFRYLEFAEYEIDEDDIIHNGTPLVAGIGATLNVQISISHFHKKISVICNLTKVRTK
jgi:hypothetical protein